jgi:hypothetical protein
MKRNAEVLQNKYLTLFGLQIAVVCLYYSSIGSDISDATIKAIYYYPKYSLCLFVSTLLSISFWIMSVGYSYLLSIAVFGTKDGSYKVELKNGYGYRRSVSFLRDSFIIFIIVLLFSFHLNGLINGISV